MPPRALTGVMHRADGLVAPRLGTTEARARLETDRDAQLLPAVPASLKSTDSTFQGDCNCRAVVNR